MRLLLPSPQGKELSGEKAGRFSGTSSGVTLLQASSVNYSLIQTMPGLCLPELWRECFCLQRGCWQGWSCSSGVSEQGRSHFGAPAWPYSFTFHHMCESMGLDDGSTWGSKT